MRLISVMEIAAICLAISYDLGLALVIYPYESVFHPYATAGALAFGIIATVAVLQVNHQSGRNTLAVSIAAIALPVYAYLPPYGILFIILSLVLALRLTFADGFKGLTIALGIAVISAMSRVWPRGALGGVGTGAYTYTAVGYIFLLSIVLVLFAAILVYARDATQRERARIASDLHDARGHGLTTLGAQLENAERLRYDRPDRADAYITLAKKSAARLLEDVRETVGTLKTSSLVAQPLPAKFDGLISDFEQTHPIRVSSHIDNTIEASPAVAHALYRIAQELLTNVVRHANATQIDVECVSEGDTLRMTIRDDGSGLSSEPGHEGGLSSIRERVAHLGGTFELINNAGLRIAVRIPRYPKR